MDWTEEVTSSLQCSSKVISYRTRSVFAPGPVGGQMQAEPAAFALLLFCVLSHLLVQFREFLRLDG